MSTEPQAPDKRRALEGARVLEKHGRFDAAVEMLTHAGLLDEAVRVLSGQRRFADAAQLIVGHLAVAPGTAATLPPDKRKLALLAAISFAKAGQAPQAIEWFVGLKEHQRAAELMEKGGDAIGAARLLAQAGKRLGGTGPVGQGGKGVGGNAVSVDAAKRMEEQGKLEAALAAYLQLKRYGDAGRMAKALRRASDAGSFFAEGGLMYEAGMSYVEAGDSGKALENLVRVLRDDPRYRMACEEVVRLAADLGHVSLKIDHFLADFIQKGPQSPRDLESFYRLSKLYEEHDLLENAKEALQKLIALEPGYRDAAERLARLESKTAVSAREYERLLKKDTPLHPGRPSERPKFVDFPDLPPLMGSAPAPKLPGPEVARAAVDKLGLPVQQVMGREVSEDVEQIAGALVRNPSGQTLFSVKPSNSSDSKVVPLQRAVVPDAPPASTPPGPTPMSISDFCVGAILQERYRLEQKVGEGGTALVFRAMDLELSELIALKVFTQATQDDSSLARFRQELTLSRQLVHPNIVRLFDIGVFRGWRFITMELLVGMDLNQYLLQGPLPLKTGLQILLQTCAGLQAAHDRGVVHRDIKPQNLFLTKAGQVKVMDFGIAKQRLTKGVTVAGMVAGTPEYMSPEQINNFTEVNFTTDLYSLGIVAFQIFTGRLPFHSPELMPLLMMQTTQAPPPPRSLNSSIPDALEALILKLMEKQPEHRFKSCTEVAEALRALLP